MILKFFSSPDLFREVKRKVAERGWELVLSEQILDELAEHLDVLAKLSWKRFSRVMRESDYSVGLEEALGEVCSDVGSVLLELSRVHRVDALSLKVNCPKALEVVAERDPDDVHVALLALALAPSLLVTDDKEAFDATTITELEKCGVKVVRLDEFLRG